MADPVYETERRNTVWPWVLGLVVLALLVWAFAANRTGENRGAVTTGATTTDTPAAVATTDNLNRDDATTGFATTGTATDTYATTDAYATTDTTTTDTFATTDGYAMTDATTDATVVPVASIVEQPDQYVQQTVTGTVTVAEVDGERGMWVEQDGQRMFVLIAQDAAGSPALTDLRSGETVTLTGVVHTQSSAATLANDLDADAQRVVADQPAFLFVQAGDIDTASLASSVDDDDQW